MKRVATIGFGRKGAERLIELLNSAGVTIVVDIRRRPDGPLSGYARQRDLPFILRLSGIEYTHRPELAPPTELLDRYREEKDWDAYVPVFEELVLQSAEAKAAMKDVLALPGVPALLCVEPTPEKCHRRLIVERMNDELGPIEIVHLV
ncbi:MAG: hypothetical protein QOG85_454 [Gaiellaceae bacterium]|nr:hypothetical protein [Gaiellaceae bacterium]